MDEKLVEFEANFSVLDRYGEDVTQNEFITNPAIGRDQQIKELVLILLTPEKSAILIGKPGIGKTAIVEGLAYRIQKNDVPEALKGYKIINIKTASLLGTMPSGESKVQKMIDELKTKEKVILFVDEVHMLIGATDSSSLDFANIFKEGLGRGSIKVIGATTTEEYERYILRDKAFTRRFQKVDVPEPTREETIQIMMGTLPKFEKQTGRKMKYTPFIQERIMSFLVDITSEYKRVFALGSRYPDVCLTLLKQAFSYTVYDNREYMDIFDIKKSIENSKNIYPDVIRKEMPRFEKEFNDIILEEKGEKPIEEWRREAGPTRYEQSIIKEAEAQEQVQEPVQDTGLLEDPADDMMQKLGTTPSMLDKKMLKDLQPVKAIVNGANMKMFAKIGPTALSKGLKDKFNQNSDSKNIDDLLLSSGISVISDKSPSAANIPIKYTVTEELKPGGIDNLLLGAPISSTLDKKDSKEEVVTTYKSESSFDKSLDPNADSLILDIPKRKNSNEEISLFDNTIMKDSSTSEVRNNAGISNKESLFGTAMYNDTYKDDNASKQQEYNTKNKDYLFGTPMYDTNQVNGTFEKQDNNIANKDYLFGAPMYGNSGTDTVKQEISSNGSDYLFGAPMYDSKPNMENDTSKTTDIFGKIIATDNDMRIKDGKIIDVSSIVNKSPIDSKSIIGDVISDSPKEVSSVMSLNNSNDTHEVETANNNSTVETKKWKFLQQFDEEDANTAKAGFNELEIPKIEVSTVGNYLKPPINETDDFVSFSDLNSGKVNDISKYVSLSNANDVTSSNSVNELKNDNLVNELKLENVHEEENYFDDFFDD